MAFAEDVQNTLGQKKPNPFPGISAAASILAMPKSLDFLLHELAARMSTDLVGSPTGKLFAPDVFRGTLRT